MNNKKNAILFTNKTICKEINYTYRYILNDFFTGNNRSRYTLYWLNRVLSSSIPDCSCLKHKLTKVSDSLTLALKSRRLCHSGMQGGVEGKRTHLLTHQSL